MLRKALHDAGRTDVFKLCRSLFAADPEIISRTALLVLHTSDEIKASKTTNPDPDKASGHPPSFSPPPRAQCACMVM